MKPKLICILHCSPPNHGASKVGDFIFSCEALRENFNSRFIKINSSSTISQIDKIQFKKFTSTFILYVKILSSLLIHRPDKVYFTASNKSYAFYRDFLIGFFFKIYNFFKAVDIYYHYHTKGVDDFVSESRLKKWLTNFFIKNVNIILLSPMLKEDFNKVQSYKKILFLPNGVDSILSESEFTDMIQKKYVKSDHINILFLSNMIKAKGYFKLLELANETKNKHIHYHFAGGWQKIEDEEEFYNYISTNKLEDKVTFHGFVNNDKKKELFKKSHIFIFPTRYKNEAFPLSILEALSSGLPVISSDEGSIPYIIDSESGIVLRDLDKLHDALLLALKSLVSKKSALYCRNLYLSKYSLDRFEDNLISILSQ